ncbi:MAG: peptidoglycan DD-metalloendopeptidase family protein [Kiloniellales bacterium]
MTGIRIWRLGVLAACLMAGLSLGGCGGLGVDAPSGRSALALPGPPSGRPPTPKPATRLPGTQPVPADGMIAVRPGDTLYAISRRYGVPVRTIIDDNRLRPPYLLKVAQRLRLPQPRHHVVESGDTIFSIARRYRVDQSVLVRLNELEPPLTIKIGQFLRLPAPTELAAARPEPRREGRAPAPGTGTAAEPAAEPAAKPRPAGPVRPPPRSGRPFLWPVSGRVISDFGAKDGGLHNDGINIAAPRGSFVRAADDGVVAYAGNELSGFGNLLLIKHADGWTTAYAHNEVLLVRRGDRVRRGQNIARVGSTGNIRRPQLHFEIRKGRDPVDPQKHLKTAAVEAPWRSARLNAEDAEYAETALREARGIWRWEGIRG